MNRLPSPQAKPTVAVCANCRRPYDTRECADPTHRAARNIPADPTPPVRAGLHECPKCQTLRPDRAFWDHRSRGTRTRTGILRKTCGQCRRQARIRRNQTKRGARLAERQRTDQYWQQQADRH